MREAIIHLGDQELAAVGLDEVVTAVREAGLQDVTELVCHGGGGILEIQVEDRIPATALDEFETVEWWERLTRTTDGSTYLCKIDAPEQPADCTLDEHATAHQVTTVRDGGINLSVVGSQAEISRSMTAIDEAGMTPFLERLSDFDGSTPKPVDALTDRQRELLETAYAMGYYEIPRAASTEEVAGEVGLDPSTVAEHLQRAERNLMGHLLDGTA